MGTSAVYDVAVIGAGPAGAAAAFHAARAGLRVALIDKARFPRDKVCGDGLTARAVAEIAAMGVEPQLAAHGARILGFELGAPLARTASRLRAAPGFPDYAYAVPRVLLDAWLVDAAQHAGARLHESCEVEGWSQDANGLRLRMLRGDRTATLRARYAIVATGAHLGLLLRSRILAAKPPMMAAARAYAEDLPPPHDVWRLHYRRETVPGYGWIFPVGNSRANVGVGLYRNRRQTPLTAFSDYCASRTAQRVLGSARIATRAAVFPLRCDFLSAPLGSGRVLVAGEAAGLVNPATGEGIDYALESGRMAARHVVEWLEGRVDESRFVETYASALHARYAAIFRLSTQLRDWCSVPWRITALTWAAELRPDLRGRLVEMLLGGGDVPERLGAHRVTRRLLGLRSPPPG